MATTRRNLFRAAAGAVIMQAAPLDLPIGLALSTVATELRQDFGSTLRKVAAIGYRQVEMFGFYGRSAQDLRKSLEDAGLACPSALCGWSDLLDNFDATLDYAHALGLKFMGCASPRLTNPAKLDDWKWNAEQLNLAGTKARKAGIQLTYHTHNAEFQDFAKRSAFHWLLSLTDPKLVAIELDCAGAAAAGHDPAEILHNHGSRIALLHVSGRGSVDWKNVFAAAKLARIKGYFVEQEPPFDRPPLEMVRILHDYLRDLR